MTAAYFGEGGYGAPASVINADSAHADHIVVADAQLLFTAHFHRAGPDLVLTGCDGQSHIIPGYFSGEHRPALNAPSGAVLSADLVGLLAGSPTPNEYAQAGPITPPDPIGRVEKVVGNATVVRNGVAVALNFGDAIYKSDVLQTGADSSVGIAFPDGTAFNLSANTRFALSDYSYDPNSTSNSALFNLVEGGFSFVAGKVAHTGDMRIGTPIAEMGIRGTAGWVYEDQVATVTATQGNVTLHFAAVPDTITSTESVYTLYAIDSNGQLRHDAQGNLMSIGTVTSTQQGVVLNVTGSPLDTGLPSVIAAQADPAQVQFANDFMAGALSMAAQVILQNQPQQQHNPNSTNGNSGSGGAAPASPPDPNATPKLILNDGSAPTITITGTGDNQPTGSGNPTNTNTQQQSQNTQTGPTTRTWDPPADSPPQTFPSKVWNPPSNSIPGPADNVVDNSSIALLINDSRTVNNLTVGAPATVAAVGNSSNPSQPGSLTVTGATDNSGMIQADSTKADPIITFDNAVTVHAGGEIQALAQGNSASIIFDSSVTLEAAADLTPGGKIDANGSGASLTLNDGATIAAGAEVESSGGGASVFIIGSAGVDNSGTMIADNGGALTLFNVQVRDGATGVIEAIDSGSLVSLSGSDIVGGTLETGDPTSAADGVIEVGAGLEATFFDGSTSAGAVTVDAFIQVDEGASLDLVGAIDNEGTFSVASGATLNLAGATLDGGAVADLGNIDITSSSEITGGAVIQGDVGSLTVDSSAILTLDDVTFENLDVTNNGTLQVDSDHTLFLSDVTVTGGEIDSAGTVAAIGSATLQGNTVVNSGMLEAVSGGTLQIDDDVANSGVLKADGGTVVVSGAVTGTGSATITNGGTFEVGASDAQTVTFDDASTLKLDQPAEFTGHIDGLAIGDIIDLTDMSVDSTSLDGSTLTVHVTDGPTLTYQVGGALDGDYFAIQSDNADGDELVLSPAVAPTLSVPAELAVDEDKTVAFDITETPVNANDPVSITIVGLPSDATLSAGALNEDGTWTLTPAELSGLTLTAGEDTSATLTITATDTVINAASTQTISLTVNPVAEGPVLGGATSATVSEGGLVAFGATDLKLDADDTLGGVMISGLPSDLSNISGGSYDAETGIWTGTAAQFNALSFNAGEQGTFALSIRAATTGVEASTTTESYTLAVNAAAPTVTVPTIGGTAQEGQTLTASTTAGQFDSAPTYTWYSSADNFTNAIGAGSTYQVKEADGGFKIEVKATATNDNGVAVTHTSAETATVPVVALTDEWINTNGGTWTDVANAATNWSAGALPRSIDSVLIDQSGAAPYVVTLPSGASVTIASLTLDNDHATLSDQGALTLGGPLTIDAGTFQLSGNGAFSGATSITNAGTIDFAESFTLTNSVANTRGIIQVDAGHTLTLSGISISGGEIDLGQGSEQIQSVSEISVPGLNSYAPAMSGDDEFIAFVAANSLPGSGDSGEHMELFDSATGVSTDISALIPAGDLHAGERFHDIPSISANGRYVVFSGEYQFTNNDGGNGPQTFTQTEGFLYDRVAHNFTVLTEASGAIVISGNGQFIASEGNSTGNRGVHVLVMNDAGTVLTEIEGNPNYTPSDNMSDNFGNIGSVYDPGISSSGRFVSFWSTSSEISIVGGSTFQTGDSDGTAQVYVYDRQSNTLQMASVNDLGHAGNGDSGTLSLGDQHDSDWTSSLSANGRYVVFQSAASNLAGNTTPGDSNIFLYDTWTHTTQLVSAGVGGAAADGASDRPEISADGNYVSFSSDATNIVAGGTDGTAETYVYNTQTGAITLVSAAADGTPADGESDLASTLSADGSVVAYGGVADNLGPTANPGFANVFVDNLNQTAPGALDITADTTITGGATINGGAVTVEAGATLTLDGVTIDGSTVDLASATATTESVSQISVPPSFAIAPAISADGGSLAFVAATSLPGENNGNGDIGGDVDLYNVATSQLTDLSQLVPDPQEGESYGSIPSISADGHYVVFEGNYSIPNPDPEFGPPTLKQSELYLYDGDEVTALKSNVWQAEISGNGQFIVASSNVPIGQTFGDDILVMDRSGNVLTEITGNPNFVQPENQTDSFGNGASVEDPAISADGRYVSFWSTSSKVVVGETTFQTGDTNGIAQLYVYDTQHNTLQMVSVNNRGQSGNGDSGTTSLGQDNNNDWASSFSADGRFVVFQSAATNFGPGGGTPAGDSNIYLYDLQTRTIALVSAAAGGVPGLGNSIRPDISPDGQFVTFASDASNLPGANGAPQVYIVAINPVTGAVTSGPELVSTGFAGPDNGQNELVNAVSNGGTVAAFGGAALAFNVGQDVLVGSGQAQLLSAAAGTVKFTGLGVTDYNAAGTTLTVTLSVEHGMLAAVAPGSGLTIVGDNDGSHGTLEFSGSLDAVNAALQSGVVYTPTEYNPNAPWPDALMGTVEDGHGNTATVTGQFDPQAQGIFTGATSNGEYDIFLANESTAPQGAIGVTADTAISNTTVNGGTLTVESDVTVTLDNVVLNGVHLVVDGGEAPSIRIDAGDTLTWAGTSAFTGPGPVVIENGGHIIHEGTLDVGFSQITFQGSGTVTENGGNNGLVTQILINEGNTFDGYGQMGNNAGGLTIDNEIGTFGADTAGSALVLETGNTIVNKGTFEATDGATLNIFNSTLDNEGSIIADGGTVFVGGPVSGGGTATIQHDGTLELGSTDAQTVAFADASTLVLDHQDQHDFSGTVTGFGTADAIDLKALAYSASGEGVTWKQTNDASGVLTISNGTQSESVNLAGVYSASSFALTKDRTGGTDVIASPMQLSLSVVDNLAVQEGQTLVAQSILDAADAGATVSYQWQSSSDNGITWQNVGGADAGQFTDGPSSFLQLTEAEEGDLLRVQGSFTNSSGQLITTTSTPTTPVADVPAAPTLTVPGSITLHDWGTAPLNITDIAAHANDTLGNVTISGLPSGAALSNSNHDTLSIANGSVTLTAAQLAGLTLHAGASDTNTILTVVASESDAEHATATTTKTISLTVSGPPVLDVTGTSATGSVPSSALTAAAAFYLTDNNSLVNTLGGTTGFGTAVTFNGSTRSDDGSSAAINITSIFGSQGLDFFGTDYTSLYINNNGNITFTGPNSTYTPGAIAAGSGNPIIAPFWADVDTRGGAANTNTGGNSTGSNLVYESLDTTNNVLTVTWDDVGYYSQHTNKLDAFQVQLISLGGGNFDIVFRYEAINWTTGDASGGSNGLGGSVARAGYSAGNGNSSDYFELPESNNQSAMLGLPTTTGNTGIAGVFVFQVESGNVTAAPVANGMIQFSDTATDDTHTASFVPVNGGAGYLGTFTLDPVTDSNGTGSVAWHFTLAGDQIQQFFSPATGQPITQAYDVTIADHHDVSTTERVSLTAATSANDVLVFNPGIGQDVVFDFSNQNGAADKIDLNGFGLTDFSQLQLSSINNGQDTLIGNLGHGDSITLIGVGAGNLHATDFIFGPQVDPVVAPGTSNVVGNVAFADSSSPDSIEARFTPEGSNYVGTFALDQPTSNNGNISIGFEFMASNDQIDIAPGETLTQSFALNVSDAQNPAVNFSQTLSVTIGGAGNDNFVFAPGIGADTVTNFNPQQNTIELNHFTDAQTIQELQSLITTDVHGDAVINLGHNDSITLANTTTAQLQQAIQAGHVLLH